jgi:hypothetical protein
MGSGLPLGTFTRARRDWGLDEMAMGGGASTGGSLTNVIGLVNNTTMGNYLAVYAICAWRAAWDQRMIAWPSKGMPSGGLSATTMIDPTFGQIEGQVFVGNQTVAGLPTQGLTFVADGKSWLTLGEIPMFIILPGWTLYVFPAPQTGTLPTEEPTSCTFVWGIYRRPRMTTLRAMLGM